MGDFQKGTLEEKRCVCVMEEQGQGECDPDQREKTEEVGGSVDPQGLV